MTISTKKLYRKKLFLSRKVSILVHTIHDGILYTHLHLLLLFLLWWIHFKNIYLLKGMKVKYSGWDGGSITSIHLLDNEPAAYYYAVTHFYSLNVR